MSYMHKIKAEQQLKIRFGKEKGEILTRNVKCI